MVKILGLALYGPMAASHRVRLEQYTGGLLHRGIELNIQSLLGDKYLKSKYQGRAPPFLDLVKASFERLRVLLISDRYDAAIVHCELLPLAPGWLESALLRIPYIYDFDDAFYLRYRNGNASFLRLVLEGKFNKVIKDASAVTAGNLTLAKYASRLNPNVTILPSVVDTEYFCPGLPRCGPVFTIGWIGSPSTSPYLGSLVEPLGRLGSEMRLRLVVIGGRAPHIDNIEVVEVPWSRDTEVELIRKFDVGVMPLPDNDWTRGKCAFKLVQYMACGVPVVASRVGANIDLVTAECGFLVDSTEQWLSALRGLRDDVLMRRNMGLASRARVVEAYSLENNLPLLVDVIHKVVG